MHNSERAKHPTTWLRVRRVARLSNTDVVRCKKRLTAPRYARRILARRSPPNRQVLTAVAALAMTHRPGADYRSHWELHIKVY